MSKKEKKKVFSEVVIFIYIFLLQAFLCSLFGLHLFLQIKLFCLTQTQFIQYFQNLVPA